MEYSGKLYGKVGKSLIPLEATTQEYEELQKRVYMLEEAVNQAVELIESGPFRKTKHYTILKQALKK